METLAQLIERLIDKNDFSPLPLIFDYLEEANTQKSWYQYRQLYSAFGVLLGRLKDYNILKPQMVSEWNYNAVLRALAKFKNRVEEIFWQELVPIAQAMPFVQSTIECAQERRDKVNEENCKGPSAKITVEDESIMQYELPNVDPINDPIDDN